jgi:hypothetical protein
VLDLLRDVSGTSEPMSWPWMVAGAIGSCWFVFFARKGGRRG